MKRNLPGRDVGQRRQLPRRQWWEKGEQCEQRCGRRMSLTVCQVKIGNQQSGRNDQNHLRFLLKISLTGPHCSSSHKDSDFYGLGVGPGFGIFFSILKKFPR